MLPIVKDLSMIKGDTLRFRLKINGINENPDKIYFSCSIAPGIKQYIFQKKFGDGISVLETSESDSMWFLVKTNPVDTKNVTPGIYAYDLRVKIGDDIFTLMHGSLFINSEVTKIYS